MKLDFNRYKKGDARKAFIAIHGWGGNKESFLPFVENIKIDNVEWFLPEAPYLINDAPPISSQNALKNNDCSKYCCVESKTN